MRARGAVIFVLGVVLGGCWREGSPPPVAPAPTPELPPAGPRPPVPPTTCADVGIILRGSVGDSEEAGVAKEKAIEEACADGHWPRAVLDCIGRGKPDCLKQLSPELRRRYNDRLLQWKNSFPSESFDELDVP